MAPQITREIKGRNIWKHNTIKRAMTPIRIAMSIAGPVYAFSWVILSGSVIRIPLLMAVYPWVGPLRDFFYRNQWPVILFIFRFFLSKTLVF
jgi:hypothetical protein